MKGGRLILGALALLAGVGLLSAVLASRLSEGGLDGLRAKVGEVRAWGWIVRLILVAVVIGGWPRWVAWAARRWEWPPETSAAALGWRWRALGWFAALEVLFVWNGFGRLVRGLLG